MKSSFLEKLIERLDRLDSGSLQTQFLRLAQHKGLLETIFHAIQEGIIVLDGEGRISYVNHAAEKFLAVTAEQVEGELIQKFLKDLDWDQVMQLDEEEWSRLVSREIEITYPELRYLNFYVVPLSAVVDTESGAVVILRDVTREREATANTVESEKVQALTLLAAQVAHEIGNPLNSLNIHLQLISREIEQLEGNAKESLQELVDVSRNEISRLDQIIHQFLKAIRPSQPNVEKTEIDALLLETLSFMEREISDRGVWVEREFDKELPSISIDRGQIKQAFFNLIKNAIQAMTEGGLLKLTLTSTDKFLVATFTDSGPGIEPDELGQIFEPFHTTKEEGSGLGLMIVQRIMRDHGGELEIRSEPGEGTSILLFLPRDDARVRLLKAAKTP